MLMLWADRKLYQRPLPEGDRGTSLTVDVMRSLARRDMSSPRVWRVAEEILHGTPDGTPARLRAWLYRHTRFYPDPPGVELVKSPDAALQEIEEEGFLSGDCDDVATLGASLALACGLPARFRLLGWDPLGPYAHVLTEVWTRDCRWADLDVTAPAQRLGAGMPARDAAVTV